MMPRALCLHPLPSLCLILSLLLSGCSQLPLPVSQDQPTQALITETRITFEVTLPAALQPGESIVLAVLDEVTGLAFNQQLTPLQAQDALHYTTVLQLRIGSVLKYRYLRQGNYTVQEHLPAGQPVRYRLHHVTTQAAVSDRVSRWTDTTYQGSTGRIHGSVVDNRTGQPIPNLLVAAGGMQTLTGADGAYLLEGLPPSVHNLVIYAQDGAYQTFQQGAAVAAGASTPADVSLAPAAFVEITFLVSLPANTSPDAPLRLAGNFIQLGNTFTDLTGGVSTLAARMPVLSTQPDGRRSLTLSLPVGADVRYKYTLGDGIWNAEYNAAGKMNLRQLIVPAQPVTLEEQVSAWAVTGPAPVTFQVMPPTVLPTGDNLSIQFNPGYGWLEPLPMWPRPDRTWTFTLLSPLQSLDSLQYRYCRNEQCGSADDDATAGPVAAGRLVTLLDQPQVITDTIAAWTWLPAISGPATVPNVTISPRTSFLAGVALQAAYHPSWTPHFAQTLRYIQEMNANWLIFSPTWSSPRDGSALLAPDPQQDIPWHDLLSSAQQARQSGLNIGLYPQLNFKTGADEYWQQAPRDYPWWVSWFDRYRAFALHHARLAADSGAELLVLGGRDVLPAIPGAAPAEGSATSLPLDAEKWWRALLTELRTVYPGAIGWALPYPEGFDRIPPFLDQVDLIYVEWAAPLAAADANLTETDLVSQTSALLDEDLIPFMLQTQKPIVLALSYPSAEGGLTGCLQAQENICLDARQLERPNPDYPQVALSLDQQTTAYNVILRVVNDRPWIGGIVSEGFYPPAMLQDKSASVYGKPAAGALWYWYNQFLGK